MTDSTQPVIYIVGTPENCVILHGSVSSEPDGTTRYDATLPDGRNWVGRVTRAEFSQEQTASGITISAKCRVSTKVD